MWVRDIWCAQVQMSCTDRMPGQGDRPVLCIWVLNFNTDLWEAAKHWGWAWVQGQNGYECGSSTSHLDTSDFTLLCINFVFCEDGTLRIVPPYKVIVRVQGGDQGRYWAQGLVLKKPPQRWPILFIIPLFNIYGEVNLQNQVWNISYIMWNHTL